MAQTASRTQTNPLKLLSVAAEMYPLVKTGGLADVAGSLPAALTSHAVETRTLIPGYPAALKAARSFTKSTRIDNALGVSLTLHEGHLHDTYLYILDAPDLFDRPGNPYLGPDGNPWPDNGLRYALLSRVAALIAAGTLPDWTPDAVLSHDWHAGLTAAYLHAMPQPTPPVAHVIHNLAFQGIFPRETMERFELPESLFTSGDIEYYGQISFMKAALQLSSRLICVSPTYAEEIKTPEEGMGLDGVLRARSNVLTGILNGVDLRDWDPETDPAIIFPYAAGDIVSRRANKRVFQAEFGLPQKPDAFLLGMVSRLTTQKGADLLAQITPRLIEHNIQLVVVGTGESWIMQHFADLATKYPNNVICQLTFSEKLGHRLHSAVDASLIPSRFEPCGLTQFHALRYGSIPIAARVGGLSDTIVNANSAAVAEGVANGILFSPTNEDMLFNAIQRAQALFRQKSVWARLQRNGALHDVSWKGKAAQYAHLLREMAGHETTTSDADNTIAPRRIDPAPLHPKAITRQVARMPRHKTSPGPSKLTYTPPSSLTGTRP